MALSKTIKGITIEIGGNTTKLQDALKDVNKTLTTTGKSLRDIDKLLKVDPSNVELLKQKQEALTTAIEATKDKLEKEKLALQKLKDENTTGEITEDQKALEREIIATQQNLKKLEDEFKQFGSVSKQQIQAAADKVGQIGTNMKQVGQAMTNVGDKMTTTVTLPIVAAGAAASKSFADVDKTMQLTNKTMGNTAEQAEMLSQAMKEAAANSTFGMEEAATATLNFARAGLTAAEAAEALAPAMNLAAGEGGNLETVSAGLVATINGFGDTFDQTAKYADVFAAACNNSALDIDSLASSMSIAAPVFKAAGYSVEDAALYMGVMANAGIDANTAATALKTGMARLAKPSKEAAEALKKYGIEVFDANGKMKDSLTVQKELNAAFKDLSSKEQLAAASAIFGKNQMSNWLALINTAPEEVSKLSASLKDCAGTTDEMADAMMSGFGGSIERLKSSIDVLMTTMGELTAEAIMPIIEKVQAAVEKLQAMDKETQQTILKIAAIVAAIGPLLSIGGRLIIGIGTLMETIPKITAAIMGMNPIIFGVAAAIGVLTAAWVAMELYQVEAIDHTKLLTEEQKKLADSANAVADSTKKAADARKSEKDNLKAQTDLTAKLVTELKKYTDENGNVLSSQSRVKEIVGELNTIMPELNLTYDEQNQMLSANTAELEANIAAMQRKAEAAALEAQLSEIYQERIQIESQMVQMEQMVAEAEQNAADAAMAFHDAQAAAKDVTELSCYEIEDQYNHLLELRTAQQDAALACSEATAPYYELQAQLDALGQEEEYIVGKIGNTSAAMSEGGAAVQDYADSVDDATDEIESAWEGLSDAVAKSVSSQIDLFSEYKKQQDVSKETLLKNMDDQVKGMEDWSNNLQELSKKGISEGLLQELAKMGPEGAAKVAAFNSMTAEELAKANEAFEKAATIPVETVANLERNYEEVGSKVHEAYNRSVENEVPLTRQQTLDSWEKIGEGVPTGVVNGINKELSKVKDASQKMAKEGVDDPFKETLDIHSPSGVFEDHGEETGQGLANGLLAKMAIVKEAMLKIALTCVETLRENAEISTFEETGMQMGEALANGLNAMLPVVQAAAASLIAAAQKAADAVRGMPTPGAGGATAGNTASGINSMTGMGGALSTTTNSINNTTNTNVGGISITVNAAEGQNPEMIADTVEQRLVDKINGREAAFA